MALVNRGKNVAYWKTGFGLFLDWISSPAGLRGRLPTYAFSDNSPSRWPTLAVSKYLHFEAVCATLLIQSHPKEQITHGYQDQEFWICLITTYTIVVDLSSRKKGKLVKKQTQNKKNDETNKWWLDFNFYWSCFIFLSMAQRISKYCKNITVTMTFKYLFSSPRQTEMNFVVPRQNGRKRYNV